MPDTPTRADELERLEQLTIDEQLDRISPTRRAALEREEAEHEREQRTTERHATPRGEWTTSEILEEQQQR